MRLSGTKLVDMVFRYMDYGIKTGIYSYIDSKRNTPFITFENMEQTNSILGEYMDDVLCQLSGDDLSNLITYTGFRFRDINAILRNNWKYDVNGLLTEKDKNDCRALSKCISDIIERIPGIPFDFITFRGSTISSFKDYGINLLTDFLRLKGNFLYEQGFTSTSILESTSYFGQSLEDNKNYNVEIRYKISSECRDGIFLFNRELSFSPDQNEYLLDKDTLSYVEDVQIDEENGYAFLTVIVIPKKLWNAPSLTPDDKTK